MCAKKLTLLMAIGSLTSLCHSLESVWSVDLSQSVNTTKMYKIFPNYMYKKSYVWLQINCESADKSRPAQVDVSWVLQEVPCMEDMYKTSTQEQNSVLMTITQRIQHNKTINKPTENMTEAVPINFQFSAPKRFDCGSSHTILDLKDESDLPYYAGLLPRSALKSNSAEGVPIHFEKKSRDAPTTDKKDYRVVNAWSDGMYHFILNVSFVNAPIKATGYIQMRGDYGYLPAILWPYMMVNGVMGLVYLLIGTVWLFIWGCSQQHSSKIHLVIGGVIVAGAVWNSLSFTDLTYANGTGTRLLGIFWLCEVVSALQIASTYLMLMFVATGYRINRPFLSRTLIIAPLVIAFVEFAALLAVYLVNDEHLRIKYNLPFLVQVAYAVEGLAMIVIIAWIMIFSILTFIHLYKRRHSDHKMFKAFSVFMASAIIAFILDGVTLSLLWGFFTDCRKNWQGEWMKQAAQQVLLCFRLCVLMWLWRPVDDNQSYGFQPLGQPNKDMFEENDDDDEDEDVIMEVKKSTDGSTEYIKLMSVS